MNLAFATHVEQAQVSLKIREHAVDHLEVDPCDAQRIHVYHNHGNDAQCLPYNTFTTSKDFSSYLSL